MKKQTTQNMPALAPQDRQRALELARELRDACDRHSALAASIVDRLKPESPGADSPQPSAWRLAEVLDDLLGDAELINALVDVLEACAPSARDGAR
jgi:hypothetical protein